MTTPGQLDDHDRFAGQAMTNPNVRWAYHQAAYERGVAEGRAQAERPTDACPACTVQPYDPGLGEHHAHRTDYGYVLYDPAHGQDLPGGLIAEGRRQATEGFDRDEEWAISYTLNGDPCEPAHGGHVFDSREQAERHLDAWRRHYPDLTYADEVYHRREVLTGPWAAAEQTQDGAR